MIGQCAVDDRGGRGAVDVQVGHGAERPAQPVGAFGGSTEGSGGRLGVDERGSRLRCGTQRRGNALGADDDGEDWLVVGTGAGEGDGDLIGGCAHSRYEQDDEGVDGWVREHERQDRLVGGCRR